MRNETAAQETFELTSTSLGSLFVISESDWTAVSKRVGLTSLTKEIAGQVAKYLPDFPQLVQVCQRWKDVTFPGIVTQSRNLSAYSAQAIQSFTALQQKIAQLQPHEELPPAVRDEAEKDLGVLAQSTATIGGAFSELEGQIATFSKVNQVVDADITNYTARLSPEWKSIQTSVDAVDRATGRIRGAWQAINNDLQSVVTGKIPITTPFLLGLDIHSALLSWQILQQESTAFPSLAQGQDRYLTGQWLAA